MTVAADAGSGGEEELADVLASMLAHSEQLKRKQGELREKLAQVLVCVEDSEPLHRLPPFLNTGDEEERVYSERPRALLMNPTDFGIFPDPQERKPREAVRRIHRRHYHPRTELHRNFNAMTAMFGLNGQAVDDIYTGQHVEHTAEPTQERVSGVRRKGVAEKDQDDMDSSC